MRKVGDNWAGLEPQPEKKSSFSVNPSTICWPLRHFPLQDVGNLLQFIGSKKRIKEIYIKLLELDSNRSWVYFIQPFLYCSQLCHSITIFVYPTASVLFALSVSLCFIVNYSTWFFPCFISFPFCALSSCFSLVEPISVIWKFTIFDIEFPGLDWDWFSFCLVDHYFNQWILATSLWCMRLEDVVMERAKIAFARIERALSFLIN